MNIKQSWSDFLDRLLQVKKTPKAIGNVFGPDNMRVGVIRAREKRVGLKVVVIYCFEGKNGHKPAFYGWCDDEKTLRNFIKDRHPESFLTPRTEFDDVMDALERML